jgi:glycosyltransferase involved in cell wall biosynthesis
MTQPLALYYQEPDPDRWFRFDRYPRRVIRRIVRGAHRPGGQMRVFLNLCAGLDRLGTQYRINDFRYARRNPAMPVGIVGKPHLLYEHAWRNPILLGASVMSHPLADPGMLERFPIRRVLVQGEWMRAMCEPMWGDKVRSCPVGIDTERWAPQPGAAADFDVLVYDKVRWEHARYEAELIGPVVERLRARGLRVATIRYGHYREEEFEALVRRCRSMVFLCEHETQGFAYQQVLSCGVPVLAWDRGGYWQDPEYYPERVKFAPVSSVPNWDGRCGERFLGPEDFEQALERFWPGVEASRYAPREFVLENLTLERCAKDYLGQWAGAFGTGA